MTGGSGFIGSHLTRRLIKLGADVTVLVKYNSIIDNVRLAPVWKDVNVVEADIRNPDSLKKIADIRPEVVFHLAAYNHVGDSFYQVSESIDSNAKGSVNVMEAYQDYERFVYISTSEVYGLQTEVPFDERNTPYPLSPYSVGKYAGELYARMKAHSHKKPIAIIRPFNAYGPYQSIRAVTPELILKCLRGDDIITTKGIQTREFNYVGNLVDGFIKAAIMPDIEGTVINVGCGEEVPIRDLVTMIHRLTESKSELKIGALPDRDGEIWRMCAANQRAKDLLGWEPKVSLEEGLKRTIEWHRQYLDTYENSAGGLWQLGLSDS